MTTTANTTAPRYDVSPLKDYAGFPCLVFPASRELSASESAGLLQALQTFLQDWASHGSPVTGAGLVLENRFVIIAHRPVDISGCGRDALMFFLKEAGERLGVEWTGGSRVFYRTAGGTVADTDRPGFRKLSAEGVITAETVVYDTVIRETDALLAGRFALPAANSWHARLLSTP